MIRSFKLGVEQMAAGTLQEIGTIPRQIGIADRAYVCQSGPADRTDRYRREIPNQAMMAVSRQTRTTNARHLDSDFVGMIMLPIDTSRSPDRIAAREERTCAGMPLRTANRSILTLRPSEPSGSCANKMPKYSCKMTLIGKACGESNFRDRQVCLRQHGASYLDTFPGNVNMWGDAR
jgi:hypothetical protein